MDVPEPAPGVGRDRSGDARDLTGRWYRLTPAESGTDTGIYRPADYPFPASRMPREGLELRADGTATLHGPGPDDRTTTEVGTWSVGPDAAHPAGTVVVDVGDEHRLLQVMTPDAGQIALRPVGTEAEDHDTEEEAGER